MPPFLNQHLFSDYYLSEHCPRSDEWSDQTHAAAEAQARLRNLYDAVAGLVAGHEGQTEEHWIRPVITALGFEYQVFPAIQTAGGTRWPDYALFESVEARASSQPYERTQEYFRLALAVADAKVWDRNLDQGSASGDAFDRRNPNVQIDHYLRETNTRWALLTNGRKWRLYDRDTSYRLDSYYEVDLVDLLDGGVEAFKYFWMFYRAAAFVDQPQSYLDQVRSGSVDFAERLAVRIKSRIYAAVQELANGFFAYPQNQLDPSTDLRAAFEGSLILLYRILFVFYAESRDLLPVSNTGYRTTYSLTAIKENLASRLDASMALLPDSNKFYGEFGAIFRLINRGAPSLGIPQYNGGLFDDDRHLFLQANAVGDLHLARAIDLLARVPSDGHNVFVDYRSLEVRHLGDIYEGLLEYHARFAEEDMVAVTDGGAEVWVAAAEAGAAGTVRAKAPMGTVYLATGRGERRATGSYYTPQPIVAYMVEQTVGRRVEELRQHAGDDFVDRVLALKICDPAMGSGHFLVETVDYLARVLTAHTTTADSPTFTLEDWRRSVVERCVYGVDMNPLAVELAKLSLWLATISTDRPLSFLDNHLVLGNALLGARLSQLENFRGTDDSIITTELSRRLPRALNALSRLVQESAMTADDIHRKERLFRRATTRLQPIKVAADVWLGGRFGIPDATEDLYHEVASAINQPRIFRELMAGDDRIRRINQVSELEYHFFHWELSLPDVFLDPTRPPGFDVVLTNPPYVNATNLNAVLSPFEKPYWRTTFDSARGAYDLYVLFVEQCLRLTRADGYTTLITPNKVLAAPYASALREHILRNHQLIQVLDCSRVDVFDDPSVYPVVSVLQPDPSQGRLTVDVRRLTTLESWEFMAEHPSEYLALLPENLWAFLLLDDAELLIRIGSGMPSVAKVAGIEAVASTTAGEADAFGPEVREVHLALRAGWNVLNTGVIEPHVPVWGLERLVHQGQRFLRPTLPRGAPPISDRRTAQYDSPKLVFSKLAKVLTAAADLDGRYCGLNVNFILVPDQEWGAGLCALFNSKVMRWVYDGYFGALRMGGGYLQVQAPQLRALPMPDVRKVPLCSLGAERIDVERDRVERQTAVMAELIGVLGLDGRRQEEPAWIPPRQSAILAALEDRTATDLGQFWLPLKQTAQQLGVRLTPLVERGLLTVAQTARPALVEIGERAESLDDQIDAACYELFALTPAEIAVVEGGPQQLLGLAAAAE